MSSNHTKVKTSEWEAMNREVTRSEAFVIQSERELEAIEAQIREREQELQEAQRAGDANVQEAVEAFTRSFREISGEARTQVSGQTDAFDREFRSMREALRTAAAQVSDMDRRTEQLARRYAEAFDRLQAQTASSEARARAALAQLDALLGQIRGLKPEIFLPAKYGELVSLRASLAENLRGGDTQAALTAAGNGIVNAGTLLSRLILMNDAYNRQYAEVRSNADRIRGMADRLNAESGQLTCTLQGSPAAFDYNISRWSDGKYDELRDGFDRLCGCLDREDLTPEQLTRIREALAQYEAGFDRCDREARTRRACAIAAEELSLSLYELLTADAVWSVTQSGYVDGDERNPYTFTCEDDCGNQIAFVVNPDSPETPTFLMEAFSEDEFLPSRIKNGVRSMLALQGIRVEGYEERDDCDLHPDAATFITQAGEEAAQYHKY